MAVAEVDLRIGDLQGACHSSTAANSGGGGLCTASRHV